MARGDKFNLSYTDKVSRTHFPHSHLAWHNAQYKRKIFLATSSIIYRRARNSRTGLFEVCEVAVKSDGIPVALRLLALFPVFQNARPIRPLLANPRGL